MSTDGLAGRPLAEEAHRACQAVDPEASGLSVAEIEAALVERGVLIAGDRPRATLGNSLKNHEDLFRASEGGKWTWIEQAFDPTKGLSGAALAEEAYRILARRDPARQGMHYQEFKRILLEEEGVAIRAGNRGNTLFSALNDAKRYFDWTGSGTFRLKR